MPTLQTRRLTLRPYREVDYEAFAALVSDTELMARLDGPVRDPEALFRRLLDHDPQSDDLAWAITINDAEGLMGHIFLQGLCEAPAPELGFVLHSAFWGRGFATEAAGAVLRYGFTVLELSTIEASVDADHIACHRVLRKVGMHVAREERDQTGAYLVFASWSRAA